jgi:excisionase family DNA binding protein
MQQFVSSPRYLSQAEIAKSLGTTVKFVRSLIRTNRLEAVKLSARCVRIPQSSLESFLQASIQNKEEK